MNELFAIRKDLRKIRANLKPTKRTARTIDWNDIRSAIRASGRAKKRVRVYSGNGFVPNSYKWRCDIQWFEICRVDGKLNVRTGWSSAQRSNATGNLLVVI